jgi:hypothetical protein
MRAEVASLLPMRMWSLGGSLKVLPSNQKPERMLP